MGRLALSPCCAAAYDMQTEMSSIAYWRFPSTGSGQVMLACWLTYGYFNVNSNNNQQKNDQKSTFFGHPEQLPEWLQKERPNLLQRA